MSVLLNGRGGKVGSVLAPALEAAGHELVDSLGERRRDGRLHARRTRSSRTCCAAIEAGVPCVVGTTGWDVANVDEAARAAGVPVFFAPNFAIGAVLMMRFAAEARAPPRAARRSSSCTTRRSSTRRPGTAKATAAAMGGDVPIHSVRLPGLVAHQEVLLGGRGELLTIRHDALSREAYVAGRAARARAARGVAARRDRRARRTALSDAARAGGAAPAGWS